ncbi:MAG: LysM peptidoglycan-binding domain-containing protein [Defluviitaleaceae bacterium]|nr:LysM peptidoglycan-binding domain-containing protein [Defluviitaleaceae bacterium]
MNDFDFPANIKQMGSIGDGMRIYVEDYVYTYMQQYAEAGGHFERLGVLVGRHMTVDGLKILIVSGILQASDVKTEKGLTLFTESSWETCRADIRKYFKGYDVVGWMQSQPGGGTLLNPGYVRYHTNSFTNPWQVLFVIDPVEKMSAFFHTDEASGELKEASGYFIYYDKNQNMHEYMLNNKIKEEKQKAEPIKSPKIEIVENPITTEDPIILETQWQKPTFTKKLEPFKPKRAFDDQKRIVNMLVPFSAVLLLISFIMGAGLIQSDGRISFLETELNMLSAAHSELVDQFSDIRTAAVFAVSEPEAPTSNYLTSVFDSVVLEPVTASDPQPVPTPVQVTGQTTEQPSEQQPEQAPEPQTESSQEQPDTMQSNNISDVSGLSSIPNTYVVQEGDTLGSISLMFYGNFDMIDRIREVNGITDRDIVITGSVLRLP